VLIICAKSYDLAFTPVNMMFADAATVPMKKLSVQIIREKVRTGTITLYNLSGLGPIFFCSLLDFFNFLVLLIII